MIHSPASTWRGDRLVGLCGAENAPCGTAGLVNCPRCLELLAQGAGRSVVTVHEDPPAPAPLETRWQRIKRWFREWDQTDG